MDFDALVMSNIIDMEYNSVMSPSCWAEADDCGSDDCYSDDCAAECSYSEPLSDGSECNIIIPDLE